MLEHFKGDEVFVKKILEYKEQAISQQRIITTKFLDPHLQDIVRSIVGNDLQVVSFGGFVNSENNKMILCPDFYIIEKEDFDIVLAKMVYSSHYDHLTHRDVLGALMSMQIARENFGDIYVEEDAIYVAMDKKIYPVVKDQLNKIKRSTVHIQECHEEVEIKVEYVKKNFVVSSFRLDKLVSSLFGISRTKAADFIRAGAVKVNYKVIEEISYLCNNSDVISLRGHGRVKMIDLHKSTRGDNQVIEGYFYK